MDKTLKEIHDVREKIYEEEKSLSHVEVLGKLHKRVEKIMQERNMKLRLIEKAHENGDFHTG